MAKNTEKTEPFEKILFKTADKLRKNMDAAEYKHIVLGLIFLKYISDSFEERRERIAWEYTSTESRWYEKDEDARRKHIAADQEDKDAYLEKGIFFVPSVARWSYLHARAKQFTEEDILLPRPNYAFINFFEVHERETQGLLYM
jgi:type I restriction enzyme M protein